MTSTALLLIVAALLEPALAWEPSAADLAAWAKNWDMCKYTAFTWACIVGVLLIYRWTTELLHHIRRIANLNHGTSSDSKQRYFTIPDERWASFKRHFILAPLFRKRHNREFQALGCDECRHPAFTRSDIVPHRVLCHERRHMRVANQLGCRHGHMVGRCL